MRKGTLSLHLHILVRYHPIEDFLVVNHLASVIHFWRLKDMNLLIGLVSLVKMRKVEARNEAK